MRLDRVALAILLGLGLGLGVMPGSAQSAGVGRIVAIGDVHGDLAAFRTALRAAGAINSAGNWVGGSMTVVQMGDLIGRGDEERQVLDFVLDLQSRAASAGGMLHALITTKSSAGAGQPGGWSRP